MIIYLHLVVTHVMSNALEVQAAHIQQRAESSLSTSSVDQTHA